MDNAGAGHASLPAADRLLRAAVSAHRGWVAVAAVSALSATAAVMVLPAAVGRALDVALDEPARLGGPVVVVVVLMVAAASSDVLSQRAATAGAAGVAAWIRHRMVGALLDLGLAGRSCYPLGDAVARITAGAASVGRIVPLLLSGLRAVVTAAAALVALALLDWALPLTVLVGAPMAVVLVRLFTRRATTATTDYQAAQGDIAARLSEALAGIRTIRASGTADREIDRVLAPLPALRSAGIRTWQLQQQVAWRFGLLVPVLHVVGLGVAGWAAGAQRITPGQLVAAVGYAGLALGLIEKVDLLLDLAQVRAGAARVADLACHEPAPEHAATLGRGRGEVEFRNVGLTLAGTAVLSGCSFRIPGGASAAIVGANGAGKSVLVGLLGRLVDPDTGSVLLDRQRVDQLSPTSLRRAVAYAFERPELIGRTVADVIALGRDRPAGPATTAPDMAADTAADMAAVTSAATAARADGFIRRLPGGYLTRIDEAPMSGGELQRLGLARALAQQARVLVLDDATSSLDTATEAEVSAALEAAMPGRTKVVITHRAATAAQADVVVWLEAGRVRATGQHTTLWRDPSYRMLFANADSGTPPPAAWP